MGFDISGKDIALEAWKSSLVRVVIGSEQGRILEIPLETPTWGDIENGPITGTRQFNLASTVVFTLDETLSYPVTLDRIFIFDETTPAAQSEGVGFGTITSVTFQGPGTYSLNNLIIRIS